ncbi:RNA polymerase sigma factor [Tenacibaculum xiamenense]|uniref:RNA polymerase sigma factor n=1 Tax=Tenacibaculum xiamenense TaxID=1261553 RepID=UPI003893ACAD
MNPKKLTDKDLIVKALNGDSKAFKIIISSSQRLVWQIVYKMIPNQEDREDLTQEVYLKVYNKLATFRHNSKLSTWIGAIAYNSCLNYLDKKKIKVYDGLKHEKDKTYTNSIEEKLGSDGNRTEHYIEKKERSIILQEEIKKLPPLYSTIIGLYYQQESTIKEIAEITKLPEGTVKSYLYRARKILKNNLLRNYKKEDL